MAKVTIRRGVALRKPIKLTAEDRKRVEKSAAHWRVDIVKPLAHGDRVEPRPGRTRDRWISDDEARHRKMVPCDAGSCALCVKHNHLDNAKKGGCPSCPYTRYYGHTCTVDDVGHWRQFTNHPTLYRARRMVGALENILEV